MNSTESRFTKTLNLTVTLMLPKSAVYNIRMMLINQGEKMHENEWVVWMLDSLVKLSLITMTSVRFNIFFCGSCSLLSKIGSVLFCHEANGKIRSDVSRAVSKGRRGPISRAEGLSVQLFVQAHFQFNSDIW